MIDVDEYPDDWKIISATIKEYAGWKCEGCGHKDELETGYMLTVHHLNSIKSDNRYENLVALCQRCHLRLQDRYSKNQLWLSEEYVPEWIRKRKELLITC